MAALVTAPLALWDWRAFYHSVATVQKVAPFREDALSFLVTYFQRTGHKPGLALAFGAVAAASVAVLTLGRRGPAGFAGSLALIYLPFIALNKQAFANYYFFVIGALCCAVAATGDGVAGTEVDEGGEPARANGQTTMANQ
jgi:hypothetical protein